VGLIDESKREILMSQNEKFAALDRLRRVEGVAPRRREWRTPRVILSELHKTELASLAAADDAYTHS
jgi:hypothetical protein